jgi:hypothetical protein
VVKYNSALCGQGTFTPEKGPEKPEIRVNQARTPHGT